MLASSVLLCVATCKNKTGWLIYTYVMLILFWIAKWEINIDNKEIWKHQTGKVTRYMVRKGMSTVGSLNLGDSYIRNWQRNLTW